MKAILLLCLFIPFLSLAHEICDGDVVSSKVLKDWPKTGYEPCIEVLCVYNDREVKKKKCIKKDKNHPNTVQIFIDESITGTGVSNFKGWFEEVKLYPGDMCFEDCRPFTYEVLGMPLTPVQGLERKSCVECFKKNSISGKIGQSYTVAGSDKLLVRGTKCFNLCQLPKGPFREDRPYSEACKKCVGMGSLVAEKFRYLVTQKGQCHEVDEENQLLMTDPEICSKKELLRTIYAPQGSFLTVFGVKQKCFEIDADTHGAIYKVQVSETFCDDANISDTQRGLNTKENLPQSKTPTPRKQVRRE